MFAYGINALRDVHPREWLRQRWWLLGVGWVAMYAVSGLWSDNIHEWNNHVQVKLPVLLLPLAFALQPRLTDKDIQRLTIGMGVMLMVGACYSMSFFLTDTEHYINEYKVSHMLPTLPKKDHIRSSIASALYVVWAAYAWPRLQSRNMKRLTGLIAAILVIYIHVLAAKSGLISLYLFIGAWGVYMSFEKNKRYGLAILTAIPIMVILGMRMIPTLRERVNYIGYTIFMYQRDLQTSNLGDVSRLISYRLGVQLIKEHPLTGSGAGDMKADMDKLYAAQYPEIDEYGRLIPHNQFLTVTLACGIVGGILFLLWVVWPLTVMRRNRQSFFFFAVWLILLLQLMIEPVLEVQFGVFVYMLFLLLQLKELQDNAGKRLMSAA